MIINSSNLQIKCKNPQKRRYAFPLVFAEERVETCNRGGRIIHSIGFPTEIHEEATQLKLLATYHYLVISRLISSKCAQAI